MADEEEIVLPDGSVLPPGYVPGSMNDPEPDPTPPPDGQTWEEYTDWGDV
jgi:hypothetical protein